MGDADSWTLSRLLEWTTKYLKDSGSDTARLDSEVLLAEATGLKRIELYTNYDRVADEPVRTAFRELVRRRAEGTPVAYLVGRREFYSLDFRVSPDVLIPRPETEFIIVTLLDLYDHVKSSQPTPFIADIGTGSGILAVCAAKEIRTCRVVATDVSPGALEIARANAVAHEIAERVDFIHSDLCQSIPAAYQFDYVLTNPPYVASGEIESLQRDVREYEPRVALDGGPDGVQVIARLVPQVAQRLKPGGWLLMEIGPQLVDQVRQLLEATSCLGEIKFIKDLAQLPRVVQARRR